MTVIRILVDDLPALAALALFISTVVICPQLSAERNGRSPFIGRKCHAASYRFSK
jgi:hypothetical protein